MPLFLAAMVADQQQHLISLLAQAVQNYGAESAEVQADVVAKFGITPAQYIELYGHCYGGGTAGANGGMVMTAENLVLVDKALNLKRCVSIEKPAELTMCSLFPAPSSPTHVFMLPVAS